MNMTENFTCPFCGGNMIDIDGYYICQDCNFIDGDDAPHNPEPNYNKQEEEANKK